jgi:hypothetical protein
MNLPRLLYTLYYMKPIQLFYQLWYRIKNRFLKITWYTNVTDSDWKPLGFTFYKEVVPGKNKISWK